MKLHHVNGGGNAINAAREAQQAKEADDKAQGHHQGQMMRALRQPPTIRLAPGVPPRRPLPLRPRPRPAAPPDNSDADNSTSDQNGIGGLPDDLSALFHTRQEQVHRRIPLPEDEANADGSFGKAGGDGQRDAAGRLRSADSEDRGSRRATLGQPRREPGTADDDDRTLTSRLLQRALPTPERIAQQLLQTGWPGSAELFGTKAATPATPRELLDALMSLLMAAIGARGTQPRAPMHGAAQGLPSLTAITLAAVQAHLSRQGAMSQAPQALTLGHVKEMLLARSKVECQTGGLSPDALQRIENALLLMPLLALNTGRPRTPGQQQLAQDRLHLLGWANAA